MIGLHMPCEAVMKTGDAALKTEEQSVLGGFGASAAR
jgi:hypothetical protein